MSSRMLHLMELHLNSSFSLFSFILQANRVKKRKAENGSGERESRGYRDDKAVKKRRKEEVIYYMALCIWPSSKVHIIFVL